MCFNELSSVMLLLHFFFFFKQKTAYEMRISDWSSDVCSSDLLLAPDDREGLRRQRCRQRPAQYHPLAGGRGRPVVAAAPGCAERRLTPFHSGARGRRRAEPRAGGYDAFARAPVHGAVHRGGGDLVRPALLLGAAGARPERSGGGRGSYG